MAEIDHPCQSGTPGKKREAVVGTISSYRPLTITPPLYRCWATMRLDDRQVWVRSWCTSEMHAGVPELGATDAWYEALTKIKSLKLNNLEYCGGVADIAKFFDQIIRTLVYRLAKAAGMPARVLIAYKSFLENLLACTLP